MTKVILREEEQTEMKTKNIGGGEEEVIALLLSAA
jgi:hypothetical protein